MKMFLDQNVYEAGLERINWIFDEFPNVIVNSSGGKDSTIILNLALQVASERGRLPLKVFFIDQEAEWFSVIDYMRLTMADPRVEPIWLQLPMQISNASSTYEPWLQCWEPGKEWIREKETFSVKENVYGTKRFAALFQAYNEVHFPDVPTCRIAGVRCEESPQRQMGLTAYETYKGRTWGKKENVKRKHYTFYPIYDWSYTDVWKAIHDNGWPYCKLYDYLFKYGTPARQMRVSNVHHQTAMKSLFHLQEIEREFWNRLTKRIRGINTAGHLQWDFYAPKELPFMFNDWREYRDHLLETLVTDPEVRERMRDQIHRQDDLYVEEAQRDLIKAEIKAIVTNDYFMEKLSGFAASHGRLLKNYGKRARD